MRRAWKEAGIEETEEQRLQGGGRRSTASLRDPCLHFVQVSFKPCSPFLLQYHWVRDRVKMEVVGAKTVGATQTLVSPQEGA